MLEFVLLFFVAYYWVPWVGGRNFFAGSVRTINDILDGNGEENEAK